MTDEVLEKCLKELQATDSLSKRMGIQQKYGISDKDICERCKNAMKYEELNMCVLVEWCQWDSGFEYFKKKRQVQNSRDCKNFLDEECRKQPTENHDRCSVCKHFQKKEEDSADK